MLVLHVMCVSVILWVRTYSCYSWLCLTGESVLVCQESERAKATRLLSSQPLPVVSCLQQTADDEPSYQLKRAILEVKTVCHCFGSFLSASQLPRGKNGRGQP